MHGCKLRSEETERAKEPRFREQIAQMLSAAPMLAMWPLMPRSWTGRLSLVHSLQTKCKKLSDCKKNNHNLYSLCARPRCFLQLCQRSLESNLTALRYPGPAPLPTLVPGAPWRALSARELRGRAWEAGV